MKKQNEVVELSVGEHTSLILDSIILQHLEAEGVENWPNYKSAKEEAIIWMKEHGYEI